MMDAQQVLVLILGIVLAVFLVLAIVLTVSLIKVTRKVRGITDKAEHFVNNVSQVGEVVRRVATPAAIAAAVARVLKRKQRRTK
ncbi:hypothetical protein HY346_01775 [Candidatus Microgenomates bacterium]|nr:hypothetical protein [Candidatus Microgenomates bacterium]